MTTTATPHFLTIADRVLGGLLGVAVGDSLGATLEFGPARSRANWHTEMIGGGAFRWAAGQPTDDTDLTLAVADTYADGYSLNGVADRFLAWKRNGPRDIGGTTAAGLAKYAATGNPRTSGRTDNNSAANGSLMRTVAVGLARPDTTTRRREAAEISAITHAEDRCLSACIAYCDLIDALARGVGPSDALARTADQAKTLDLNPAVVNALTHPSPSDPTGYVIGSLSVACWALANFDDYKTGILEVVNLGGDADTTGAIAGGLLGTAYGTNAIPARWTAPLWERDHITTIAPAITALRTP